MSRLTPPFYWLMTRLLRLVVQIFGRYEVIGAERIPAAGGLLVVSNHLNLTDPPLLGAAMPRRIRFMAKQELFDARPFGIAIKLFGAFPVRRFEGDLKALRTAEQLLRDGEAIGMFPEGHRSRGKGLLEPFPGTALIALRTGATILPVAITGTEGIRTPMVLLRNPHLKVVIGEPFTLATPTRVNSAAVREGTDEIMRHVAALLPPRYRGVYADPGAKVAAASRAPLVAASGEGGKG